MEHHSLDISGDPVALGTVSSLQPVRLLAWLQLLSASSSELDLIFFFFFAEPVSVP